MHGEYLHSDFLSRIDSDTINTIFEVGAREGNDSVALSKYYKNSQVYSFECNPYTVNTCKETVRGYSNIHFNDVGLGNLIEIRQFYPYLLGNTGASSFLKRVDYVETQTNVEDIKIDTIENFCKNAGIYAIDLLCMDTQGYELNILKGCGDDILSTIRHIILEEPRANAERKYLGSPSHTEIQTFLHERGFSETARVFENLLEDNVMYSRELL
jgi:FkbM family methyltransferase